jgi:AraC family transcriptional regulator, regulatory protein of adaptative response / methylated-DNA-[protein]-cysteine methyltransferase
MERAMIETTSCMDMETIRFVFADARIGAALIAESAHGVAAIFIGDNRSTLYFHRANACPPARMSEDPAGMAAMLVKIVGLINAPQQSSDLPLDLRGSPVVKLAVRDALRARRPDETRSSGHRTRRLLRMEKAA